MIALRHASIQQGRFTLHDFSLEVPTGEYAVLTGPTGSGKTTILEAIAGLRPCPTGTVHLRQCDVTRLSPAARAVGYVPQESVLFPTMTVGENLGFGLIIRGKTAESRVLFLAEWLGLTAILNQKADRLSGGEARRVALGRALAFEPDILLFDEPLTGLDEPKRDELIGKLMEWKLASRATVLHVTHSSSEADALGDARYSLSGGRIVRV